MSFDKNTDSDGFIERVINMRRTTKMTKGGGCTNFKVLVVVGNSNGTFGIGLGGASEVASAIQKALEKARRNLYQIELNGNTLFAEVNGRYGAAKVFMKPASEGTGIIAGGAMRAVFKVLGVKDVLAKNIGSANPLNVVYATLDALQKVASPASVADKRGKSLDEIME